MSASTSKSGAAPVVVIGAGHNGLSCAATLARAGRKVLVLEAREQIGGLAARESFAEGYAVPGVLHSTTGVRATLVARLGLQAHGLRRRETPLEILCPQPDGPALSICGDKLSGPLAEGDAERYASFRAFIARVTPVVRKLLDKPPLDPLGAYWPLMLTGLRVRRLGKKDMIELLRLGPMCVADWMRDVFAGEHLRAALAVPALQASFTGPWSAGSAAQLLLRECCADGELVGGPAALIDALAAATHAAGGEIRSSARVARILLDKGAVVGVQLHDGEELACQTVLASCDPRQALLELVGAEHLSSTCGEELRNIRCRGTTAIVRMALSGPLELQDGRQVEALRTGSGLDVLERAFDPVKYKRFAEEPLLELRVPSVADPSLAPAGHHVVSIHAHAAPYELEGGWTDAAREALGDAVQKQLTRFCPELAARLVAREVLTPADLAERYGLSGGHLHHGEHALDQLMFLRPTARCSQYRTPVPGLWLAGSGSHPGGGLTGMPGHLAARACLRAG